MKLLKIISSKKSKKKRKKWSPEVKKLALEIFKHYIKIKKTPAKVNVKNFLKRTTQEMKENGKM